MKVYIAAPYTANPEDCTRIAIVEGDLLLSLGYIPYIPHLTHFWHQICPRHYEDWMKLDFEWVAACDVVYRLEGKSSGADREVELAGVLLIPVVYSLKELMEKYPI